MFGSLGALYGISFFINQSQKVRNLQLIDQMLKKPNKEMRNAGMRAVGWS